MGPPVRYHCACARQTFQRRDRRAQRRPTCTHSNRSISTAKRALSLARSLPSTTQHTQHRNHVFLHSYSQHHHAKPSLPHSAIIFHPADSRIQLRSPYHPTPSTLIIPYPLGAYSTASSHTIPSVHESALDLIGPQETLCQICRLGGPSLLLSGGGCNGSEYIDPMPVHKLSNSIVCSLFLFSSFFFLLPALPR